MGAPLRPRTRIGFEGTVFTWFSALFCLAALLLHENLVLLMGCAALACGQAARLFARSNLSGLEVSRSLPGRGRVGVPLPVTWTAQNPRRRAAVGVEVEERLGPRVRPVALRVTFTAVDGGATERAGTQLVFRRRGLHRLGGFKVGSRYPLGLFRAAAVVEASDPILVRPREGRATAALRSWLGGAARARVRPSLLVRGDDVFHGVREFRDGDDPRRIHWRTTARTATLAVTEWHREQGRSLVILLGRGHGAGFRTLAAFERAVSAAATIYRAALANGLEARLDLGLKQGGGRAGFRRLAPALDALAIVRAQGGRRPRAALRRLGAEPGRRIVVYVAAGEERGIKPRLAKAAGRGGSHLLLRADEPGLERWVRGL